MFIDQRVLKSQIYNTNYIMIEFFLKIGGIKSGISLRYYIVFLIGLILIRNCLLRGPEMKEFTN